MKSTKIYSEKRGSLLCAGLLAASGLLASAQSPAVVSSPDYEGWRQRSVLMMELGDYAGVIDQINGLRQLQAPLTETEQTDLAFMLAKAYYEQGDARCISVLREFISQYPSSQRCPEAQLAIGDYYFFDGKWGNALAMYRQTGLESLSGSQLDLYTYRTALCLIKIGEYGEASRLLDRIAAKSDYQLPVRFYKAYIDYAEGREDQAYRGFAAVAEDLPITASRQSVAAQRDYMPTGLEAGYYMAQIDFARGKYRQVIEEANSLMNRMPVAELAPEMNRLAGESYFKLGENDVAYGYLTNYLEQTETPSPSAVYATGVIEYERGDLDDAAERFSLLADDRNDLGQSASLYLGQIAIRNGDDNAAAMAFSRAAERGYDPNVSETALYNYVAASTRGGAVPFSSSIDMLEGFLKRFPNSQYAPQVEEGLATAFYNEKDYAKALKAIERIPNPSASVMAAKQKVVYELGIESLSNGRPKEAVELLREAVELRSYDKALAVQARLWLGEALYRTGDYKSAAAAFETYLKEDSKGTNRALALYDLAYALYMQGDYKQAETQFANALKAKPALSTALRDDATIRQADCRYYTGKYRDAQTGYETAIRNGANASDYAAMRRAVMLGLNKSPEAKIEALEEAIAAYPTSLWLPSMQLERALTLQASGKTAQASAALAALAQEYPSTVEARKGLLQLAILNVQKGNMDEAEKDYKEVITRWPSSDEAALANEDLRRIYASQGRLNEYAAFLRSVPNAPQLDEDEMEKLTFDAAETAWAADIQAVAQLERYIATYPNGKYLAQSLLDLAESAEDKGEYLTAISYLERLLRERPTSAQAPDALLMKGQLIEEFYPERNADALEAYRLLERTGGDYAADAWSGIMRTSTSAQERIAYARRLQQLSGLDAEMLEEAQLYEARALSEMGNGAQAEEFYTALASNPKSAAGAEAAVALGQYYLDKGDLDSAEKTLSDFIDQGTPHQYWLARGFIALADVYHAKGKDYVAAEYLRSLSQNYPGDETEIKDMINSRLNKWKL